MKDSLVTYRRDGLYWLLASVLLWWLLAGNAGWYLGLPLALLASALAIRLQLPWPRLDWRQAPELLLFFAWQLLRGGWDVARRAVHPRMPLDPAWVELSLDCRNPQVQLLLSALVGLLPGTLASHVHKDCLHLHVLDQQQPWQPVVRQLEHHLAALFGVLRRC